VALGRSSGLSTRAPTVVERAVAAGAVLRFSRSEWTAFIQGAKNGEFDEL
jgi:hypothetical protein